MGKFSTIPEKSLAKPRRCLNNRAKCPIYGMVPALYLIYPGSSLFLPSLRESTFFKLTS